MATNGVNQMNTRVLQKSLRSKLTIVGSTRFFNLRFFLSSFFHYSFKIQHSIDHSECVSSIGHCKCFACSATFSLHVCYNVSLTDSQAFVCVSVHTRTTTESDRICCFFLICFGFLLYLQRTNINKP